MVKQITVTTVNLLDYPTQTLYLSPTQPSFPNSPSSPITNLHFIIIPGNPSICSWYIPFIHELHKTLLPSLTPSQRCHFHCVSYAGQGNSPRLVGEINDNNVCELSGDRSRIRNRNNGNGGKSRNDVSQTLHGQILHKIAFIDYVKATHFSKSNSSNSNSNSSNSNNNNNNSNSSNRIILLGHSIGCHMINKLLHLRPDLSSLTLHVFHLCPFIRLRKKLFHRLVLSSPPLAEFLLQSSASFLSAFLPSKPFEAIASSYMSNALHIKTPLSRKVALQAASSPAFARNFIRLGAEELRDVPEEFDVGELAELSGKVNGGVSFLYGGGGDVWGPKVHYEELKGRVERGELDSGSSSSNVTQKRVDVNFESRIRHDFCVREREQSVIVSQFVARRLLEEGGVGTGIGIRKRSKL